MRIKNEPGSSGEFRRVVHAECLVLLPLKPIKPLLPVLPRHPPLLFDRWPLDVKRRRNACAESES